MSWELTNDRPIFQQLTEDLLLKIVKGEYPVGSRLEGVRDLAVSAGVNPNTMQRALTELEKSGILFVKRGDGRYITNDQQKIENLKEQYIREKTRDFIASLEILGLRKPEIEKAVEAVLEER